MHRSFLDNSTVISSSFEMEGETIYTWDENQKTVTVDEPSETINDSIMMMRNKETYERFEDVIYKVGPNIDYKNGFVVGGHTKRGAYEINDDLPKSLETPLQKLTRLQKETVDMVAYLQTLPQNTESAELNGEKPAAVLAEMEQVKNALDALMLSPEIQNVDVNAVSPLTGKVSSDVISKAARITPGAPVGPASLISSVPAAASADVDPARVLTLENRMATLEGILGASPSQVLPFSNISNGLEEVALRLAAIDPQKLEAVSKKTRGLLGELDDLSQSMGRVVGQAGQNVHFDSEEGQASVQKTKGVQALSLDLAHVGKVDALYDLVYQWRAAGPALPVLAARLESLKAVHQNSATIAARLQTVETQQKNIALIMENALDSLEETKVSMRQSLEAMARSVDVLERRFEKLGK